MAWPEDGRLLVRSLARGAGRVEDVRLLGHPGRLEWTQTPEGLTVTLPAAEAVRLCVWAAHRGPRS